jgi:translation initiation factor 2 subunit 2
MECRKGYTFSVNAFARSVDCMECRKGLYEKILDRGMEKIPRNITEKTRFEMPTAQVFKTGVRTIINNFYEIANSLRRDPDHFLKFLLKELATKCEIKNQQVIFQGVFPKDIVNKKIEIYVKNYVICPECKKPDTKIIKEARFYFLRCEACGARHHIEKV